ncbi:MAG: SDR family NAD(P)-dependent oxidoreductase [Rhodobacteraceae bacterium]|nr:SDR family NAD(P)-dependent oxidoreductase [Paracoccaceae bacterium]
MASEARSILITGCSSGIGQVSADLLRQRGWRVFATCRKQADCDRLSGQGFESIRLDYEDAASITSALDWALEKTGGRLGAVFNNGAYAVPGAVEDVPRDAMRAIFETNFFGYHDLIRQIIPVMRTQGGGRIVNCSSILGFAALPWRGPYNSTKFALEGLTDTLRVELRGSGIEFILIEPGPVTTLIRQNSQQHFEKWIDRGNSYHARFYEKVLAPHLYHENPPKVRFELPPEAVAGKLIHALESRRPRRRYYVTTPTYIAGLAKRLLPTAWFDRLLASWG